MESPWAQQIRSLARRHTKAIVDAIINEQNHIVLKRADGIEIDGGFIKAKKAGSVVYYAYTAAPAEPDSYLSKDGEFWMPGASVGRFLEGSGLADTGCWTGDRFIVGL